MYDYLFDYRDARGTIDQHRMSMQQAIGKVTALEKLDEARSSALLRGRIDRPALVRDSAQFDFKDEGANVRVTCMLKFEGDSGTFQVKPTGQSVRIEGKVGTYGHYDELSLVSVFPSPADPNVVKEKFRSILADVEAMLDAVALEVKQHNETLEDQVDRLVETRRRELSGLDDLRKGLSDGL